MVARLRVEAPFHVEAPAQAVLPRVQGRAHAEAPAQAVLPRAQGRAHAEALVPAVPRAPAATVRYLNAFVTSTA